MSSNFHTKKWQGEGRVPRLTFSWTMMAEMSYYFWFLNEECKVDAKMEAKQDSQFKAV